MRNSALARAVSRGLSTNKGSAPGAPNPHEYCSDVVKRGDYDGYLYSLLQGSEKRSAVFAIRAFNVETAAIKDSVRGNLMPGRMRFQWWKDSLADIFAGDPPPQPVALALADIIKKEPGVLTRRWFDRVLDARMVDLEQAQPETLMEMETYAENTASSLLYLSLEVAGIRAGSGPGTATLGHAAGHVGKAVGICTFLRALAQPSTARGQEVVDTCILPMDVMRKNTLRHTVLERGPQSPEESQALSECVFDVASVAKGHMDAAAEALEAARAESGGKLPTGAFAALLPGVRAAWYLETLQKCNFEAFDESLRPRSPLWFQWRLAKAMMAERF